MEQGAIQDYLTGLQREYATGKAREHGYRHALKALIESIKGYQAINEPARIECGAPDYVVERKSLPVGYIEAKDVGADLKKIDRTSQLKRYKAGLGNLILTDYLKFWWYVDGEIREQVEFAVEAPKGKLELATGGEEALAGLLDKFLSQQPQKIARPRALAVRLANMAGIIRELIEKALKQDTANGERKTSTLVEQLDGFREVLLRNLGEEDFADMYAQTIVYGMFAARENHDRRRGKFTRECAAFDIPKTNPFLRRLFAYVAGQDIDPRLEWAIKDLAEILDIADMAAIKTEFEMHKPGDDPVVHFYETFLKEYDPTKRELRGVYYTPQPVVGYIVRSIDELLKREFGLNKGLADAEKIEWKPANGNGKAQELHRVQVLDPACGTGSFLLRVVDEIHNTFAGDMGQWPAYVREHLLPRLHGFELMMAPYTVAHMKLGMRLKSELDVDLRDDERLNVFLTNTLDNPHLEPPHPLFMQWLTDEAKAAWEVKSRKPILVILGNPPYSGHSANKGPWINDLLHGRELGKEVPGNYYQVDGQPLGEKNPKWLQDDYVKFLRWAQWRIERTGQGIVGMITNHGYLDNPTFRGMRKSLMDTFDQIYVLDLHGNDRKKERVPEDVQKELGIGPKDENVFDIQQGVAICLLVKLPESRRKGKHKVYQAEYWGDRDLKSGTLSSCAVENTQWARIMPKSPHYLFLNADSSLEEAYAEFPSIESLFVEHSWGIATRKDYLLIDFDRSKLTRKFESIASLSADEAVRQHGIRESPHWDFRLAHDQIKQEVANSVKSVLFRPFDSRYIFYEPFMIERGDHRFPLMRHMLQENLCLISVRRAEQHGEHRHFFCCNELSVLHSISSKEGNFVYPLYLYPFDEDDPVTNAPGGRRPNLSDEFIAEFTDKLNSRGGAKLKFIINGRGDLKKTYGPEDVFHYMYAVFHSPEYRRRYADFLKIDFPRLPLTTNRKLLRQLCALGHTLARLHLMDASAVDTEQHPLPKYPVKPTGAVPAKHLSGSMDMNLHEGGGGDIVEKVKYKDATKQHSGQVWINGHQYFEGVPREVWDFHVGGYQVCEKWLKDRKGRELSYDDKEHYKLIVAILGQTIALMARIDKAIEKHGGWPID